MLVGRSIFFLTMFFLFQPLFADSTSSSLFQEPGAVQTNSQQQRVYDQGGERPQFRLSELERAVDELKKRLTTQEALTRQQQEKIEELTRKLEKQLIKN